MTVNMAFCGQIFECVTELLKIRSFPVMKRILQYRPEYDAPKISPLLSLEDLLVVVASMEITKWTKHKNCKIGTKN